MEFEKDTPPTDEQRILAESKKMSLKPLNPFLKPEDLPDPIVVDEAQPNLTRDTEDTANASSLMQPSLSVSQRLAASRKPRNPIIAVIAIISPILLIVGFLLSLAQ